MRLSTGQHPRNYFLALHLFLAPKKDRSILPPLRPFLYRDFPCLLLLTLATRAQSNQPALEPTRARPKF